MMLLLYSDGLRVVITTANLIIQDWDQKTQGYEHLSLLCNIHNVIKFWFDAINKFNIQASTGWGIVGEGLPKHYISMLPSLLLLVQ